MTDAHEIPMSKAKGTQTNEAMANRREMRAAAAGGAPTSMKQ